jgi:N-succinyldiaminopimelate aminotransferase
VPTTPDNVLVTTGATGGLGAVLGAILDPGDDVLVLAPYWPLIVGIVRCFRARPLAVPVLAEPGEAEQAVARVRQALTPRTSALYLGTPNNPTGRILPRAWIEALVELCRSEDLWIVADDVYEDYVFEGEHVPTRSLAPERTFSAHSVSKAWGMAGNRCGWILGPADAMPALAKVGVHAFYSAPTAAQVSAWRALDGRGDAWAAAARETYRRAGVQTARRLGVPEPEGSTFLFLDVAERLDDRGLHGFLCDCADRGLLLAPGPSFGPYPHHVRLCFTCAPPDVVARGADVLASILGR